ncbi:MAG: hypothetical protein V4577_19840 [Bacteroidota bacterium]
MKPVDSTAEILYLRMLNRSVDKRWVDWAYDMLVAGFDSESLVMLAGETEFYNQFEMHRLADKVFEELGLRWDNREQVLKGYTASLLKKVLNKKAPIAATLDILKDAYLDLGYEDFFNDFFLLSHAKRALTDYGFQHYWKDATKENIDQVIIDYFRDWLRKNEE